MQTVNAGTCGKARARRSKSDCRSDRKIKKKKKKKKKSISVTHEKCKTGHGQGGWRALIATSRFFNSGQVEHTSVLVGLSSFRQLPYFKQNFGAGYTFCSANSPKGLHVR